MSSRKTIKAYKPFLVVIAFCFSQFSMAGNWEFTEISESLIIEKCITYHKSILEDNFEIFKEFYPTKLVVEHKGVIEGELKRLRKYVLERTSTLGYKVISHTASITERLGTVSVEWTSNEKKSGAFSCEFSKQNNGKWAYGTKIY